MKTRLLTKIVHILVKEKCIVFGCSNTKTKNPDKHFFWAPRDEAHRKLWMSATGKTFGERSGFLICQDHFDVSYLSPYRQNSFVQSD